MKVPLRLLLVLFSVFTLMAINTGPTFASSMRRSAPATAPAAALAASYQAMDAAMNAANPNRNPSALATPARSLLSQASTYVSNTPAGTALYTYDTERVSVLRSWTALHTHDYSAVNVWSTFQTTSQVVNGTQATVTGDEVLHIDATIQDNGQVHHFSPAKQAAQAWIKKSGHYLAVGDTNHATATIHHTAQLRQSGSSWVIESDTYWDPLVQPLASDHHTLLKQTQAGAKTTGTQQQVSPTATHRPNVATDSSQRQAAINYAEQYVVNYNQNYPSYPDADCANFVSQALYDGSGANLNGDSQWYAGSYDFINAGGLFSYMEPSPYSTWTYGEDLDYNQAAYDDSWYEYPGDLIFYDWGNVFGFGPANGAQNHVVISVTQDANGYTYEDSHTSDLQHYYWDLGGGTQSGYWFMTMSY